MSEFTRQQQSLHAQLPAVRQVETRSCDPGEIARMDMMTNEARTDRARMFVGGRRLAVVQCLHIPGRRCFAWTRRPIVRLAFDQDVDDQFLAAILMTVGIDRGRIRRLRTDGPRAAFGAVSMFSVYLRSNEDCERVVQIFGGPRLLSGEVP